MMSPHFAAILMRLPAWRHVRPAPPGGTV